jgi:hypothetical protein
MNWHFVNEAGVREAALRTEALDRLILSVILQELATAPDAPIGRHT